MKKPLLGLFAIGLLAGAAARHEAPPAKSAGRDGLDITVSLSARELTVATGGSAVATYPVAIGAPAHPTPRGSYHIRHVVWNPRWVPPDSKWARNKQPEPPGSPRNPMGRVKLFFREPDYYIHGTREVDSLGQAESHGCLRMRNGDAIELARLVMEHGGSSRPPSWFRRVLNRVTSTQEVYLDNPIPIRVVS